jgi:hypothetical protein
MYGVPDLTEGPMKLLLPGIIGVAAISTLLVADEPADGIALPLDEAKLRSAWQELGDDEAAAITLRHLRGLVRAAHKYHDVHGSLPPAVVPNPDLPPDKRLSGLVLLLPHLDAADFPQKNLPGKRFFADDLADLSKKLYRSIDLKKAWDDPANAAAAKTIVPAFLLPDGKRFRDAQGFAVTHIAFVRGANGKNDGVFNETDGITFLNAEKIIEDGAVNTLALGQISEQLGPWIAAGHSTSRHVYHQNDTFTAPTFGSGQLGCYFATCDSFAFFLDVDKTDADTFHALATRAGGEVILPNLVARYKTRKEWMGAQ